MGIRSPIFKVAFSLSRARTWGLCKTLVWLSDMSSVKVALGRGMT